MNSQTIVRGEIKFEDGDFSFSNALMHVYLENVSVVDVSSEVVGHYKQRISLANTKNTTLPFTITLENLDMHNSYAIRAHIDIDGDGSVSKGDLISMQSYPVVTFGYSNEAKVIVRQVK